MLPIKEKQNKKHKLIKENSTLKKTAFISAVILLTLTLLAGCSAAGKVELNVSAAASMTDVIKPVNDLYMSENPDVVITTNLGSSGNLQTQIENGAPTDIFISAASKQMNALQEKDLIIDSTRQDLLNNKVVLIVPPDSKLNIASFEDLTGEDVTKIAMGDPAFVPAGQYGQKVLDQLGLAEVLKGKLVLGSDVRQVLTYVESSNVDAGIVYLTDALTAPEVKVVADAPANINESIVYPVAVIKSSKNVAAAEDYIDFLSTSQAQEIFEKYGFSIVQK
jgi:molybdate transport system substrate-binding protein